MKSIYIFVAGKGFIMSFESSGPELKFTQDINNSQDFDLISQARFTIAENDLNPSECVLLNKV